MTANSLEQRHVLVLGEDTIEKVGANEAIRQLPAHFRVEEADGCCVPGPLGNGDAPDAIILCTAGLAKWESVIREVKGKFPFTPLLVISSSNDNGMIGSAIRAGAAGYLLTLSDRAVLLRALETILSGGIYLPPCLVSRDERRLHWADDPTAPVPKLTRRQLAVLRELGKGFSNKQIAGLLGLSEATIKVHIAAIMKTLRANNRTHVVLIAEQLQLINRGAMNPPSGYQA